MSVICTKFLLKLQAKSELRKQKRKVITNITSSMLTLGHLHV